MRIVPKNKKWAGYVFYVILVTALFLNVLFPSEALLDSLGATLEGLAPGLRLSVEKVFPLLPYGLRFSQSEISSKKGPSKVYFRADTFFVGPAVRSLFKGDVAYRFTCRAFDGYMEGDIQFFENNFEPPFAANIELRDIDVKKTTLLGGAIGRFIEGTLTGVIRYNGKNGSRGKGAGTAELRLSNGRMSLFQKYLKMEAIDFSDLRIRAGLENQRFNLTQVTLRGPEIRGTLSGTITIRKEWSKSTLALKGAIEPLAGFFQNLKGTRDTIKYFKERLKRGKLLFTIRGTISDPRFRFT